MTISTTRQLCSISHLSELVASICDAALLSASIEAASNQQVPGWEHLLQRPDFYRRFKLSLASNVAQLLGTHDKYVQRVYFLEPFNNPNRETNQQFSVLTTFYLLVLIDKQSAALNVFIEALEQSLNRHLDERLSSLSADHQPLLDIVIVTKDAQKRKGYSYLSAHSFT